MLIVFMDIDIKHIFRIAKTVKVNSPTPLTQIKDIMLMPTGLEYVFRLKDRLESLNFVN